MAVPKDFFNDFQSSNNGLETGVQISVAAFWQGEIFDLKVAKYLNASKSIKTH